MQAEFPERLEAAARDRAEIERRGTVTADSVRAQGEFPVVIDVRAALALVRGEACGHEAVGQFFDGRDVNLLTVQISAFSTRSRKHFLADWIKHNPRDRPAFFGEANRDGEAGVAVREVRGAVERVHVPAIFRARRSVATSLFGGDRVVRIMLPQSRDDQGFGAAIGLRDDIHFTLVGDLLRAVEFRAENRSGFARDFDGKIEELAHGIWIAPPIKALRRA